MEFEQDFNENFNEKIKKKNFVKAIKIDAFIGQNNKFTFP